MAVDASVERQLHTKILPSVADGLHIVGRWSDSDSLEVQIAALEHIDVLIYDPFIDEGALLQHLTALRLEMLVCCWCSRVEDVIPALRAGVLAVFLESSSATDVDIAFARCRRLLEQRDSEHASLTERPVSAFSTNVVALPHTRGIEVRSCDSIVHVQGEGNYTSVVFEREPAMLLSRTQIGRAHV